MYLAIETKSDMPDDHFAPNKHMFMFHLAIFKLSNGNIKYHAECFKV